MTPRAAVGPLLLAAPLALTAACSSSEAPVARAESTRTSAQALSLGGPLPADPDWADGFSPLAVQLGQDSDGTPLYACRAMVEGMPTPGKTNATWNTCDVAYGGGEYWVAPFQTLAPGWSSGASGSIPSGAFALGSESGGADYPCRVPSGAALQAGHIRPGLGGCEYPYGGTTTVATTGYSVLAPNLPIAIVARDPAFSSQVPLGAIRAGTDDDGAVLYSCATSYGGQDPVGKTRADWGASCDVPWSGGEQWVAGPFHIAVLQTVAAPLDAGTRPVQAGTDSNGAALGICAAGYNGGVHVGKYLSWGACNFGFGGAEVSLTSGYSVVAFPSHPPIWTEIVGGQPGSSSQATCALPPTAPLLPANMPPQCTAGVVNQEAVWACPTWVEPYIPHKIGYGSLNSRPQCQIVNGEVVPPSSGTCEVVYITSASQAPSCFAAGEMPGWELVWDHEFVPNVASPGQMQCEVMGCGGACPAQILPH